MVYVADDFNVPRIDLAFDTAPTTAGLITVTKDSGAGAAYDTVIRTINPIGLTAVVIEGLHGFVSGDKLLIEYANADGVSITGSASLEFINYSGDIVAGRLTVSAGTIRSSTSKYAHYYHLPLAGLAPGASGATYTEGTADHQEGWLLDDPGEYLTAVSDIHESWDTSQNPKIEATFTCMIDNAAGAVDDILKITAVVKCRSSYNQALRTQTVTTDVTVGQMAQYAIGKFEIEMDRDATDNPILPHDVVNVAISLHAGSDITAILVNDASFYWPTTHVGIELADV
jgi:hypothetical protein